MSSLDKTVYVSKRKPRKETKAQPKSSASKPSAAKKES